MCEADLKSFNKSWLDHCLGGRLPAGVIQDLPGQEQYRGHEQNCLDLAGAMISTFVAPAIDIDDLERWRDADSGSQRGTGGGVGDMLVAKLFKEWLHLARIESLKVQHGCLEGLLHLHINLEEVSLFASLNNTQISRMAASAAVERIPLFRWAWPRNVFGATKVIHKNVYPTWAFGLAA